MKSKDFQKNNLPAKSGVYFFKKGKEILYIGKATNLRTRVRSYFSGDIIEKRGVIISEMVEKANKIEWQETNSVLEALLLEANLIKKHQPKYNTKEKDDKSHNYIVITSEDFPRVLIMRGRELFNEKNRSNRAQEMRIKPDDIFGPFPQGGILRDALKIIRKIFPFRDTCVPASEQGEKKVKACFNKQIGLCPGVCSGEISKTAYRKNITNIKMFLGGKRDGLIKKLEKGMLSCAKKRAFEEAEKIKHQIFALNHIQDIALLKDEFQNDFSKAQKTTFRIEGYDAAHLSGVAMLGVMTVVEGSRANKNEYRKFNIKTVDGVNDIASLKEVLERRFGHAEWQYPKLIVVDGAKAQKNCAEGVLKKLGIKIPVVAVVKDERHKAKDILGKKELVDAHEKEILLVNHEAHRFSISGHRKKMRKLLR